MLSRHQNTGTVYRSSRYYMGRVVRLKEIEDYMSAHVFLNLLNELGESDKMRGLPSIYLFFATSLVNSIIQERKC